jgi:hypothetical protein
MHTMYTMVIFLCVQIIMSQGLEGSIHMTDYVSLSVSVDW